MDFILNEEHRGDWNGVIVPKFENAQNICAEIHVRIAISPSMFDRFQYMRS